MSKLRGAPNELRNEMQRVDTFSTSANAATREDFRVGRRARFGDERDDVPASVGDAYSVPNGSDE